MDLASKRAEIEARRAQRQAEQEQAREEQAVADLEAYDALETEHGDHAVASLALDRYVPGHTTMVVVKAPDPAQYKRFVDQVGKAVEKNNMEARRKAQDLLAESCWIYPAAPEARKAMLKDFPGLLVTIAMRAASLVEGKVAEEGKG